MIDPLVSLAFSVQSNKGVYAVLLGSGISRSSGIPTGWDIVLDLTQKLAGAMGEDTKGDPEAWYRAKLKKEPDYSDLLDNLCKTQAERQQLLRSYFEPTADERDQGLKQPTKAHRAIAKLMVAGYIRVAITTNFDRLLEQAIQDEGTAPVVIMSDDGIVGAVSLAHQKCCIIKLHGDYLDTRIKNTPSEVGKYEKKTNVFLDQVFDQFGLIVCGWSAQWDLALRAALERCQSRRFTMFWASHGTPKDDAKKLISLRDGAIIPIADADRFFGKLADMVQGIEQSNAAHPASLDALVAVTKRYLSDPRHNISLSDLLYEEVEAARNQIEEYSSQIVQNRVRDDFQAMFENFRLQIARVQRMVIHGAAFGTASHFPLWINAIQRIGEKQSLYGPQHKDGIRLYPSMILLYSAGLIATAAGNMDLVAALLMKPIYRDYLGAKPFLLSGVWTELNDFCKTLPVTGNTHVPKSEHLFAVLREPVKRYLQDDARYEQAFNEWEYLISLAYLDKETVYSGLGMNWAPPGRYTWPSRHDKHSIVVTAKKAFEDQQQDWPPLRAGLFGGKVERVKELQDTLAVVIGRIGF